jgi:hypothetical protein
MIQTGAVVRAGCAKCRTIFDVDLRAIEAVRGADFRLIDQTAACRITRCRGRCYFLAARSMDSEVMTLANASLLDPIGVAGLRAADLEPPDSPPPVASAASRQAA